MKRYYEFMSGVSVELNSQSKQYIHYFDKEYWFAKKSIGKKSPLITCFVVDKLIHSTHTYPYRVYRRVHFKRLFWFEYVVDLSDYSKSRGKDSIQLYVKRHPVSAFYMNAVGPFMQTNVLEPLLYIAMVFSAHYLLHASTVSKKGIVTAYAGHGGAGKTTTALNVCLREDYAFMGDDLIFINTRSQEVAWFPRPLHLFWYNVFKIPFPTRLTGKIAFLRVLTIIGLKNCIRFFLQLFTRMPLLISTRIDVRTLYPQLSITHVSKLGTIKTIGLRGKDIVELLKDASDLRTDALKMIEPLPKIFRDRFMKHEHNALKALQIYTETS